MNSQSLSGSWTFRQANSEEWLPGRVPGSVHLDLLDRGLIPDPFIGDQEKRVQWVAESDWEYARTFQVDPGLLSDDRIFLVCDGLDTLADLALNGRRLASTDNMFRQYRWEVKDLLRYGDNTLTVFFHSPVRYAREKQKQFFLFSPLESIPGGPYLRKAACQFGWDWGPRLPAIGIWKEIRLEGYRLGRIADVHLRQTHQHGSVRLVASVTVDTWTDAPLAVSVQVTTPDGQTLTECRPLTGARADLTIEIERPELWWPNGYGAQPLYKVQVQLETLGTALDQRLFQVGLRTLELRQEPDEWGKSFTFVVNGVPIFAKGSNWIPAETFHARITDEIVENLLRSAVMAHQNMLRVWGGGYYEDERFYDLCDRFGILVWQDFMFSCAVYPLLDEAFLKNLREETRQAVRQLRHRACLALWCGNNEMEQGWREWGWDIPRMRDHKAAYEQYFYRTLPELCAEEDPDHSYWYSSPSSGIPFADPNGQAQGDAHYWAVWHGRKPFSAYQAQFPRFMSEFGFQSLPPLKTIQSFARPEDLNLTSYVMEHHQRSPVGNTLIVTQMAEHFRLPKDFASTVYLSMVLQAEGIRSGVEHWRRNKDRVSGTLYWQLNDVWPVTSWSSLDYSGRWKALHYAARRFYAPLLLSAASAKSNIDLHLTSDLREDWTGAVEWSLERLDGQPVRNGHLDVEIGALASARVTSLDFAEEINEANGRDLIFVYRLMDGENLLSMDVHPFVPDKHLELRDPGVCAQILREGDLLHIEIGARSLARFVEVELEGVDIVFSDNYFDLPAGQKRTITCKLPSGWDLERARSALTLRTLFDSY